MSTDKAEVAIARCGKCRCRRVREHEGERTCLRCGHTWQRRYYTYAGLGAYGGPRAKR